MVAGFSFVSMFVVAFHLLICLWLLFICYYNSYPGAAF